MVINDLASSVSPDFFKELERRISHTQEAALIRRSRMQSGGDQWSQENCYTLFHHPDKPKTQTPPIASMALTHYSCLC